MTATQTAPTVLGIAVTDAASRLIAADKAEEQGLADLAARLRRLEQPVLLSYDGSTCTGSSVTLPATYHPLLRAVKNRPGSKKRAVGVRVAHRVTLYGRYWDEGTHHRYTPGALRTGDGRDVAWGAAWPDTGLGARLGGEETAQLAPGKIIVQDTVYCGREACPTLFLHPDDAALLGLTWLPACAEPRVDSLHPEGL